MRARSLVLRVAAPGAVAMLVAAFACEDPTEVTLVLTTNVPCTTLMGTTITVGEPGQLEDKPAVAVSPSCDPAASASGEHAIGTFVVIPSGDRSASFGVRVVSGVTRMASDCTPGGQAPDYRGCIVARRELAFVPHTRLSLPIAMLEECVGNACTAKTSCNKQGQCQTDRVNDCAGGVCQLPGDDGGATEGGPADGPQGDSPSASADEGAPPPGDGAPLDSPTVGPPSDATPPADASDSGGSGPGDASVLGSCMDAGSSSGITCGTATCASGQVCCVMQLASGSATSTCTTPSACPTSTMGLPIYSALACRSVADCPSGQYCCLQNRSGGNGYQTTCAPPSSCVIPAFSASRPCKNSCECPADAGALSSCLPTTALSPPCSTLQIATCGGSCG